MTTSRRSVLVAFACLLGWALGLRVAAAQEKSEAIGDVLERHYARGEFNGSVLVAENGRVILQKGYGLANMEWQTSNEADTKHRIGSLTKQFSAALVLQLSVEGKLSLADTVSKHLNYYRKDTGNRMTIHHLLTHTSGLPNYTTSEFMGSDAVRHPFPTEVLIREHCSGDLEFAPGEKWSYSNSGYLVLGAIIEAVTGAKYEDVLQQRIFRPLGMNDSGYDRSETVLLRRAAGYAKSESGGFVNAPYLDMTVPYAAGALYSTVQDLYRWDRALYGDAILSNETKARMFAPHIAILGPDGKVRAHYGYGWIIAERQVGHDHRPVRTLEHFGGINGFMSAIVRFPESGHLIVLLTNTDTVQLGTILEDIIGILYTRN